MTKYRESKAELTSKTYNRNEIEAPTENIYEALSIIAKRSQQINLDIKKELHEKLEEFATHNDSLEEIFEGHHKTLSRCCKQNAPLRMSASASNSILTISAAMIIVITAALWCRVIFRRYMQNRW